MSDAPSSDSSHAAAFARPVASETLIAARKRAGVSLDGAATDVERAEIARMLDLESLDRLEFAFVLEPEGADGWRLKGRVRAVYDQRCGVTLEPIAATLDEPVERLWRDDLDPFDPDEGLDIEVGVDSFDPAVDATDGPEATPDPIDPAAVALETLALGLDPYPRAPGVRFDGAAAAPAGVAPMSDDEAKPFSGLAALKSRLDDGEDEQNR